MSITLPHFLLTLLGSLLVIVTPREVIVSHVHGHQVYILQHLDDTGAVVLKTAIGRHDGPEPTWFDRLTRQWKSLLFGEQVFAYVSTAVRPSPARA
jgi:hypothetical protein